MDKDKQEAFHKELFTTRFEILARLNDLIWMYLIKPMPDIVAVEALSHLRLGLYQELLNLVDRQAMSDGPSWEGWVAAGKERNAYEEVAKIAES